MTEQLNHNKTKELPPGLQLEKVDDRAKEQGQTEKTPLIIEDFEIKNGKLKFKKGTKPYNHKKKKYKYKKG